MNRNQGNQGNRGAAPPPPQNWQRPRLSPGYRPAVFRRPARVARGWRPAVVDWEPYAWVAASHGDMPEWSNDWRLGNSGSRWLFVSCSPNRHARAISIRFDNYVVLDRATLTFSSGDVQEVDFGRQECAPGEYSLIDVDGPWRIVRVTLSARTPDGPAQVTLRFFR